jgi:hypothetical protein
MTNQQHIDIFNQHIAGLKQSLQTESLHPQSVKMVENSIRYYEEQISELSKGIETEVSEPETIEEPVQRIHSMKFTARENELINMVDNLRITGWKKSEHNWYYWEVKKLVETLSTEVNKWIFNVNGYEMNQYKSLSQDIKNTTRKQLDAKLRYVKLWLCREVRACIEANHSNN